MISDLRIVFQLKCKALSSYYENRKWQNGRMAEYRKTQFDNWKIVNVRCKL